MKTRDSARVTVARIVRPHGIRGEVAAEILTDFPERLALLSHVELYGEPPRTPPRGGVPLPRMAVSVRSCRLTSSRGGQAIFQFEGIHTIDEAQKLVGCEVQIPMVDRIPLPSGSYYVTDLIGCEVRAADGAVLGEVRDVDRIGGALGTPILAVHSPCGEILIPLAQDICVSVDIAARRILVNLPEGLHDLNTKS